MRKLGINSILVPCLLLVASVSLAQSVKGENVVVGKDAITIKLADGKT